MNNTNAKRFDELNGDNADMPLIFIVSNEDRFEEVKVDSLSFTGKRRRISWLRYLTRLPRNTTASIGLAESFVPRMRSGKRSIGTWIATNKKLTDCEVCSEVERQE